MPKTYKLASVLNQPEVIEIGDRQFEARAFLLSEQLRWERTPELEAQVEILAKALNDRRVGKGSKTEVTAEWLMETLTRPEAEALYTILLTGSLPEGAGSGNA